MRKNTANAITIFRIVLVPIFVWALKSAEAWTEVAALVLFLLASASDCVDGYIARHYNQVTNFGKIVDPLADKLLVMGAILVFVEQGQMNVWAALVILAREFAVTSLRVVAATEGIVMAAAWSGKVKTVVQMAGIILLLTPLGVLQGVQSAVAWLMALVTVWSGIDYFVKNREIFQGKKD